MKALIKRITPAFGMRWVYKFVLKKPYSPARGKIKAGDFLRDVPFCARFGEKRGGAIDRRYIEGFLERESAEIRGRVLEVGDNLYTTFYGGSKIVRSDVFHVDGTNPKATFVGDLSNAPQLPNGSFDCIVLTQTLHLIYDVRAALNTCHRILKPGGALLLTVPGITPIDGGVWRDTWYWSFTSASIKRLMDETFPKGRLKIESFGNVYVAAAFLYGIGRSEIPSRRLNHRDPQYPVILTVKAVRASDDCFGDLGE